MQKGLHRCSPFSFALPADQKRLVRLTPTVRGSP